LTYCEASL